MDFCTWVDQLKGRTAGERRCGGDSGVVWILSSEGEGTSMSIVTGFSVCVCVYMFSSELDVKCVLWVEEMVLVLAPLREEGGGGDVVLLSRFTSCSFGRSEG